MLLLEAARALTVEHRQRVLHRDVKPDNLMVRTAEGRQVWVDFGVGYLEGPHQAASIVESAAGDTGIHQPGGVPLLPGALRGGALPAGRGRRGVSLWRHSLRANELEFATASVY
ncbi:hypothetical protein F0U59_40425 [Archangium gephyra]|nr:hypothetical protein F0U59_40425 [Archangium gephyra]